VFTDGCGLAGAGLRALFSSRHAAIEVLQNGHARLGIGPAAHWHRSIPGRPQISRGVLFFPKEQAPKEIPSALRYVLIKALS
jgi:hypothetical protein